MLKRSVHYCKACYLAAMLLLSSCIDVIDLDLNDDRGDIVINANLNDLNTDNEVKITTAVRVKDDNEFPPVTGAVVTVKDETTGSEEQLIENYPGVYSIEQVKGVSGHTYSLRVITEGREFTARATMPAKVAFVALGQTISSGFRDEDAIQLLVEYNDPPVPGNAYRFITIQNGLPSQSIFVRNDTFTNGNPVSQTLFNSNIAIGKGDVMGVYMQCITPEAYTYFYGLMQLQGDNINQGVSPTNPPGNISGGALGFFNVHTAEYKSRVVE